MPIHAEIALPAVEVVEITDPTQANVGFEIADTDLMQLQSTPMQAKRVLVRLEGSIVAFYSSNLRVRTRRNLRENFLGFTVFGAGTKGYVDGLPVGPDRLVVIAPDSKIGFVADAGYESISYLVAPDELASHLRVRQREEDFRMPKGVENLAIGDAMSGQLFAFGKRLVEAATQQPELFNDRPDHRAAAKVEMLENLLATLAITAEVKPDRSDRARRTQSSIVKAAEQFAMANADEHLYVTDLCEATAVSERSLEYAFKSVMGMSPVAYLTRLRLHRVRKALLVARPGSTTVAAEALNWGFWHFGDFAKAYKACFGESPSDTLRQPSGETRTPGA